MSQQSERPRLDTLEGCAQELSTCNQEVAEMAPDWAAKAGTLKMLEQRYKRMFKEAMRGTKGSNADERSAVAHQAVEEVYRQAYQIPEEELGLSAKIEELVGEVESHKVHFNTIERRSSNVQSVLQLRRQELGMSRYTPPPS